MCVCGYVCVWVGEWVDGCGWVSGWMGGWLWVCVEMCLPIGLCKHPGLLRDVVPQIICYDYYHKL